LHVTPRSLPPPAISSSLNSLFRVLCNFPSRYLSPLDLSRKYLALDGIFHPPSGCTPRQPYSQKGRGQHRSPNRVQKKINYRTGFSPSLMSFSKELESFRSEGSDGQFQLERLRILSSPTCVRFSTDTLPMSLGAFLESCSSHFGSKRPRHHPRHVVGPVLPRPMPQA